LLLAFVLAAALFTLITMFRGGNTQSTEQDLPNASRQQMASPTQSEQSPPELTRPTAEDAPLPSLIPADIPADDVHPREGLDSGNRPVETAERPVATAGWLSEQDAQGVTETRAHVYPEADPSAYPSTGVPPVTAERQSVPSFGGQTWRESIPMGRIRQARRAAEDRSRR
jgi:hypothetical protein